MLSTQTPNVCISLSPVVEYLSAQVALRFDDFIVAVRDSFAAQITLRTHKRSRMMRLVIRACSGEEILATDVSLDSTLQNVLSSISTSTAFRRRLLHGSEVVPLNIPLRRALLLGSAESAVELTLVVMPALRIVANTTSDVFVRCARTGNEVRTFRGVAAPTLLQRNLLLALFSPCGRELLLVSDTERSAVSLDASTGQTRNEFHGHQAPIFNAAYSADGGTIVTASQDCAAMIWVAASGECVRTLLGHSKGVVSAAISPCSQWALTASLDGTARVWAAASGEPLALLEGPDVRRFRLVLTGAVFSPAGGIVAVASGNGWHAGRVDIWRAGNGEHLRCMRYHAHTEHVAFSPSGDAVAAAYLDGSFILWEASSGTIILEIDAHESWICSVCFAPDGNSLLTGSADGWVRLWTPRGRCLLEVHFDEPVLHVGFVELDPHVA